MEKLGKITLYNADCMEIMKGFADNQFDLAIVDPPYGIDINFNMGRQKGEKPKHKKKDWDNAIPQKEYFDELKRVSKNQIIWGGNYFTEFLEATKSWIFWDKEVPELVSFADGELAWTSFDKTLVKARIPYSGFTGKDKDMRIHPTQKPVQLYKWLLNKYAKQGDTILDTHLGSGSSAIAAHDGGFEFTGIELDEEYYNAAKERIILHQRQLSLF